ncbi:hypothetical protein [Streptomyces sp. NPDC005953]|uniref:DUF7224 domain-containing protein n=1 Tax=Streptomyces sp. NPDC005953 TaxID=3156719 RepID=UPI0033EDBAAA
MLIRTVIRSSSATLALPFLILFVFAALGDDLTSWVTPHYWPSATGNSTFALPFVSAACAAVAAWEGARLKRGRVFEQAPVRGSWAIALPLLLPVALMGLLAMATALYISVDAADVGTGLPDWGIIAVVAGVLMTNTLAGHLVGRVMSGLLAAPVALIASFFFNAYPSSWSIYWLRHLVGGGLDSCCSADVSVDETAVLSALVFTTALSLACAVLIHRRGGPAALITAVVLSATGFGTAAYIARDLTSEPVQARATDALVCDGSRPTICLWPEVKDKAMVQRDARKAVARLESAGIRVPDTLTMAQHAVGPETYVLGISTNPRAEDLPAGVASGLLPQIPPCALEGKPYPAGNAAAPVAAWLYATAGERSDVTAGRFGEQEAALAQNVRKHSSAVQLDWYQRNMKAMSSCGAPPQLTIAGGAR